MMDSGLCKRALERFESLPFPGRRDEHWRFSNLAFWGGEAAGLVEVPECRGGEADVLGGFPAASRFFDSLVSSGKFDALAAAAFGSARTVRVPDGEKMEISGPWASCVNLFEVGRGAELVIRRCEDFSSPRAVRAEAACFSVLSGGKLRLETLFSGRGPRWSRFDFYVEDGASVSDVYVECGASDTRTERNFFMEGAASSAEVAALVSCSGSATHDIRTSQIHNTPGAHSNLLVKNILRDSSRSAFAGLIRVKDEAQRTSSYQSCRSLLLSPKARAQAVPVLEIMANDVACSHGCAVAQPDPEQIFYMKARGLDEREAQSLLVGGFANEILEKFSDAGFADLARSKI